MYLTRPPALVSLPHSSPSCFRKLLVIALSLGLSAVPAAAASQTWDGSESGDFGNPDNWVGAAAPGNTTGGVTTSSDIATFNNAVNTNITVDAGRTVGRLNFDTGAGEYNISGNALNLTSNGVILDLLVGATRAVNVESNIIIGRPAGTISANSAAVNAVFNISGSITGLAATTATFALTGTGIGSTISGPIQDGAGGTLNLLKTGTGTFNLSGNNTFTGTTAIQSGGISINSMQALGNSTSTISLGNSSATVSLVYTGGAEATTRGFALVGSSGGGILESSGTGAWVINSNVTSATNGAKTLTLSGSNTAANTFSGSLSNSANASNNLIKDGTGSWTLNRQNDYAGFTRVNGGTLNLDFAATGAPTSNIVNSLSTLNLGTANGGNATTGTLNVLGKANTANTQTFTNHTQAIGSYYLNPIAGENGTLVVDLAAVTNTSRASGYTLDVGSYTGGSVRTTAANSAQGILGPGWTFNKSTFASNDGSGNIVGFAGFTANGATSLTTNAVIDMSSGSSSFTGVGNTAINGLRFNQNQATTLTLDPSRILTNGVGILVTGNVGNFQTNITGGLLAGGSSRDFIIMQHNTSNDLVISSTIVSNNTATAAITKSGAGRVHFAGLSTTSGTTYINEGTALVTSDPLAGNVQGSIGFTTGSSILTGVDTTNLFIGQRITSPNLTSTTYYITAISGNTVTMNTTGSITTGTASATFSDASALGIATTANALQIARGATVQLGNGGTTGSLVAYQAILNNGLIAFNRSNSMVFANVMSGVGGLSHDGSGTTTISSVSTITGATTVNAGTLMVSGTLATSRAMVNNGGRLGGTGTIGGVTLNAGGKLAPGASIGILSTADRDFLWNGEAVSGSQLEWELDGSSSAADLLNLGLGKLDKGTGNVFSFNFLGSGAEGFSYTLINFGSTDFIASDFSYTNLASNLVGEFELGEGSLILNVTQIPEPTGGVLLALGLGWAMLLRRRTRHA